MQDNEITIKIEAAGQDFSVRVSESQLRSAFLQAKKSYGI